MSRKPKMGENVLCQNVTLRSIALNSLTCDDDIIRIDVFGFAFTTTSDSPNGFSISK